MARTTKRARTKVPPVIAKLLKAVNDLPLEDAVDELQLAWEDETSLEKRQTLMKARIKLLEDAQKPRKGAARPRKKPARKSQVEEAEVTEEAEATEDAAAKKRGGTGTVTAMDLDGLGSILGGGDDTEGEGANGAGGGADGNGSDAAQNGGAGDMDLSALAELGDATTGEGTGGDAAANGAGADGADAAPPEPEEPKEPEKPAYKKKKLNAPDYTGDEMYQQIWKEMQQEGIDKLTAVRMSDDDFDTRLEQARKDADWLGFGAIRMGDSEWDQAANSIVFDCDHITADWQLDQRLNQGLSEMAALQGADAPDLPEVDVPDDAEATEAPAPAPEAPAEPAPEPEPTPEPATAEDSPPPAPKAAAVDPMANMDALFAELGGDEEEATAETAEEPEQEPVAEAPKEEVAAALAPAAEPAPEPEPEPEPQPEPAAEVTTTPAADAETTSETGTDADADVVIPTNEAGEKILTEDRYDIPVDPTPIEHFHEDPQFMQIWEDMVVEALENLGLAQRWKAEFDARLRRVDDTAARLLHAAQQMQFEDYVHLLEDFTFDLPTLSDDAALDDAVDKMREDLQALRGDKTAVEIPAKDTYTPPKPKAQTVPQKPGGDEMRKPPKPMVTDTDESAQTRDDWESEDFWSWDDEDGGDTTAPGSEPSAPEVATPDPAKPEPAKPAAAASDAAAPATSGLEADAGYRAVWDDVVQETLEGLRLIRAARDPFADRLSKASAANDRLRHAAEQMDYAPWLEVLKTFAAKTRLIGDAMALDAALDNLLADLTLLHQGSAAVADLLKKPAAPEVSTTVEEARAAAQSRSGKATLDDIYKFFPKPE